MPPNGGFTQMCPLDKTSMTIVSTAPETKQQLDPVDGSAIVDFEENCRLVSGDYTFSLNPELKSFPPIDDTIVWFQHVDWKDVRRRSKDGLNNVGLVVAVIGEKLHDFGCWLAQV
jgi:hypothetical protein